MQTFQMQAIGRVHSPYKQKFGIPRQPGLVTEAEAWIEMYSPYDEMDAFRLIEGFSHIWIEFIFHQTQGKGWQPLIRPPRLGGKEKVGVFASRSPYRPNALGLSLVELISVSRERQQTRLMISGPDLLDGTPVIDIKPYLAYAESKPDARSAYAHEKPKLDQPVEFAEEALAFTQQNHEKYGIDLIRLIKQLLQQDPRPAYFRGDYAQKVFSMSLYDFDLNWQVLPDKILVLGFRDIKADTVDVD